MVINQQNLNSGTSNIDAIITHAAIATVMTGNENANCDQSEPNEIRFILARIKIKPNIYRELKELGLDVNVVVNKLLENFLVAYKAFWDIQDAGGGIRTHAGEAHRFSRPTPYHSATPASL